MKTAWRKYATGWIAAAICAGVVLLAGTRLVVLSLHQTAAQMHAEESGPAGGKPFRRSHRVHLVFNALNKT